MADNSVNLTPRERGIVRRLLEATAPFGASDPAREEAQILHRAAEGEAVDRESLRDAFLRLNDLMGKKGTDSVRGRGPLFFKIEGMESTFVELKLIFENPIRLSHLLRFLRSQRTTLARSTPYPALFTGRKKEGALSSGVTGIRVIDIQEDLDRADIHSFYVLFLTDGDKVFIDHLYGHGALDLGLAFLKGRTGTEVSHPVEKAILAALWDTRFVSGDPAGRHLTVKRLSGYLGKTTADPIGRLRDLQRAAWPRLREQSDEELELVGRVKEGGLDADVCSLRLGGRIGLGVESAGLTDDKHFFRIIFREHDGKHHVVKAEGNHAFKLALAYFQGQTGRTVSNPLELALLSSLWKAQFHGRSQDQYVTWDHLCRELARTDADRIAELWELERLAQPWLPERPEELVLAGFRRSLDDNDVVLGLRLEMSEREATKSSGGSYFFLRYTWDGERYIPGRFTGNGSPALSRAVARGAVSLALALAASPQSDASPLDTAELNAVGPVTVHEPTGVAPIFATHLSQNLTVSLPFNPGNALAFQSFNLATWGAALMTNFVVSGTGAVTSSAGFVPPMVLVP